MRLPPVIATSPACGLLVAEKNRSVRRAIASGGHCIGVGGSGCGGKMQLAREDRSSKRRLQLCEIVHAYAGSAAMLMEMSAALAECVRAPTLIKSGPASA